MSTSKQSVNDSHLRSRGKICVVCHRKSKQNLTPNLIDGLKQFTSIFDDISPNDERVPTAICDVCRKLLGEKMKGKGQHKNFKIPSDFSFASNDVIVSETNSEVACCCYICKLVKSLYGSFTKTLQPKKLFKTKKKDEEKRLCKKCLSISQGITLVMIILLWKT